MSFGLSGPSGTGKTTLATAISEQMGIELYLTNTTAILAEHGINPVGINSVEGRLTLQELLLENHFAVTQKLPRPFISDRTPLDYIAYMLAEVAMHGTDAALGARIDAYVDRALFVADNTYQSIFICSALPVYEHDPKRPPFNLAYQRHFQMIVEGALGRTQIENRIQLRTTDHAERLRFTFEHIIEAAKEISAARSAATLH